MFHEDDIGIADGSGDPVALALIKRQAIVILVHHRSAIEFERGLSGKHKRLALRHRQCRGVGHVSVKGDACARHIFVKARMNVEGRRFGFAVAGNNIAVIVADQEARSGNLAEGIAIGIDQKQVIVAWKQRREMVADALMHSQTRRGPEAGRQIPPRLHYLIAVDRGAVVAQFAVCGLQGGASIAERMGHDGCLR